MKCLSLRQPWASLVASGRKTIEVRSWRTHYRGPLVICASARPRHPPLPAGEAVCVVELIDVRPLTAADLPAACLDQIEPEGLFAWVLRGAVPLPEPFGPIRGQLKLFDPPAALRTLCRRLLSAHTTTETSSAVHRDSPKARASRRAAGNRKREGHSVESAAASDAAATLKAKLPSH